MSIVLGYFMFRGFAVLILVAGFSFPKKKKEELYGIIYIDMYEGIVQRITSTFFLKLVY